MGCKVRYNANNLSVNDADFHKIIGLHDIISFCPEVSVGMPTPRPPAEITNGDGSDVLKGQGKVVIVDGENQTQDFITAAKNTLLPTIGE